ncbi:MAG: hypothetical protein QOI61_2301 [Actinomycetota bacterium]|jgi:hypothetical protein
MRGLVTIRRVAGAAIATAALAGATAGPAGAMANPACSAHVVSLAAGDSGSCSFTSNEGWAIISIVPENGALTASLHCVTNYGNTYDASRTITQVTSWQSYAPGYCTLTLTAWNAGTAAVATAAPWSPIYTGPV